MDDEINLAQRHRFGGHPEKRPMWPVVLGLVVLWVGVILLVRGCA